MMTGNEIEGRGERERKGGRGGKEEGRKKRGRMRDRDREISIP